MTSVIDYQAKAKAILLLQEEKERERAANENKPPEEEKNPYKEFKKRYKNDLPGCVRDMFIWEKDQHPTDYQDDFMTEFQKKRRGSLRGPHGLGKTAMAAWIILWFALTRDGDTDWKIPTTASAWRQLIKFLWPEIHKWQRRIKWEIVGRQPFTKNELTKLSIKLETGEAFAMASDNHEYIEGAHATELLMIFDESKAIPDDTWDAAEGAMSVGNTFWLAISTPGEPQGRFYDIHKRAKGYDDWYVKHVLKDEVIDAGRMSVEWAEKRREQWGEISAVYQNRVEGNFAASDEDGVIPLSWIERANERWLERNDADKWEDANYISVDVGRGGDPSVIGLRCGRSLKSLTYLNNKELMSVTGKIAGLLKAYKDTKAIIDVIGLGAGVVDRLRENKPFKHRIFGFNASEKTTLKDKTGEMEFVNVRSAAWWTLRELLMDDLIDLPPDDLLIGDLTAPHYKMMSGGKMQIEAKVDIKKRIGRSTDAGDVAVQAFFAEHLTTNWRDFDDLGHIENFKSRWAE